MTRRLAAAAPASAATFFHSPSGNIRCVIDADVVRALRHHQARLVAAAQAPRLRVRLGQRPGGQLPWQRPFPVPERRGRPRAARSPTASRSSAGASAAARGVSGMRCVNRAQRSRVRAEQAARRSASRPARPPRGRLGRALPVARRLARGLAVTPASWPPGQSAASTRRRGFTMPTRPSTPPSRHQHGRDRDRRVERLHRRVLRAARPPRRARRGGTSSTATRGERLLLRLLDRRAPPPAARAAAPSSSRSEPTRTRTPRRRPPRRSRSGSPRGRSRCSRPDAMPALCSSASASTVAVSGATVDRQSEGEDQQPGQQLGQVVDVRVERAGSSASPAAATSGPTPMKKRGP